MLGSAVVYSGLVLTCVGLLALVRPLSTPLLASRLRGLVLAVTGLSVSTAGLLLPAFDARPVHASTRLDEFAPLWQFHEVHTIRIAAPPARVFEAIRQVRADEIAFFQTLTWIRRGGRPMPPGILNAASTRPLLDVATGSEFIWLAVDPPRELVVGVIVGRPAGVRLRATPALIMAPPPGFSVATMNFRVTPDGPGGSLVSTETRVCAGSAGARRQFAAYWRVIYPGSSLIRRMWLRAIERRAKTAWDGLPR
jgi:hypothetical protein